MFNNSINVARNNRITKSSSYDNSQTIHSKSVKSRQKSHKSVNFVKTPSRSVKSSPKYKINTISKTCKNQ